MGRKWSFPASHGHVGLSSVGFGLVLAVVSVGIGAGFNVGLIAFRTKTDVPNAAIVSADPAGGGARVTSVGSIASKDSTTSDAAEVYAPSRPEETDSSGASSRVLQITSSSPVDRIPNVGVVEPSESSVRQTITSQVPVSPGIGAAEKSFPGQAPKGDSPTTLAQVNQIAPGEPSQPSMLIQPKATYDVSTGDAKASANPVDG